MQQLFKSKIHDKNLISGMSNGIKLILIAVLLAGVAFNLTPPRPVQAATFTVNIITDTNDVSPGNGVCADSTGFCSLRAAIEEANAGGTHTITLPAGTYILNSRLLYGTVNNSNLTINGASAATTIIQMTSNVAQRNRILLINDTSYRVNIDVTINNVTFQNGYVTGDTWGGSAILAGGISGDSLTLNNVVFSNNITPINSIGGGALNYGPGGDLTVNGCTFTNNQVLEPGESGGAILLFFQSGYSGNFNITNSTFIGNSSAGTLVNDDGGGAISLILDGGSFNGTITKNTFLNNSAASGYGGALLFRSLVSTTSPINVEFNRFYGNTAAQGGGAANINGYAIVDAGNNWWGCNSGPSASPCDIAGNYKDYGRPGVIISSPWIILENTASPTSGGAGSNTTLTASFLSNNGGEPLTAADVTALQGVTVNWLTPTNGSITASETTIQSDGQAEATMQLGSTCPSTATETVSVDGVPNGDTRATASVSVICPDDLTATASNDVGGTTTYPTGWTWTVAVGNAATTSMNIPSGTVVLRDQLPLSGLTYGTPSVPADADLTGTVSCGIASSVLTCTASTALTLAASGAFDVNFSVTPTTYGVMPNPRSSGSCLVDPDNTIPESDETNNSCTDSVTVNAAPAITSGASTTFTVGAAGSFTVTTSGYPTGSSMSISTSDTLPDGVTLTDNANGTASLAGTPAAGTGGVYTFTITADNGIGTPATQSFTLTINQAPAFSSGDTVDFLRNASETFTVIASGYPTPAISHTGGTMPSGVSLTDNGDGTATLSGTATGTAGAYTLTFTASNGVGTNASQTFTLNITEAPDFTSSDNTTFTVGTAGTFTIQTSGFPAAAISTADSLPSGVTLTDNGDGTATLGGTPATGYGGEYTLTLEAANGVSPDASQTFTLTVNEALAITSANNTTFSTAGSGSFTVTTSGYPLPAISITAGSLPSGVSLTDNSDGTATISGTPTGALGDYVVTLSASNGVSTNATQIFTLTVTESPAFTSADNTTFEETAVGSFTITTSGSPVPSITTSSTLPSGVTLTDNSDGTATLGGTPAFSTGGVYVLNLVANNGIIPNGTQTFTLTVNADPSFTSADNTTLTVGSAASFTVTTNGYPDPSISITSGTLPDGVTFLDNGDGTGSLGGTPATGAGGVYTLELTAQNTSGPDATQTFTITVNEAPSFTSGTSVTFVEGAFNTFTVSTLGYPVNNLSPAGTFPAGVSFTDNNDNTATLSGTPSSGSSGTYNLTINAFNGGTTVPQSFTLTVSTFPTVTLINSVADTGDGEVVEGEYTNVGITQLLVTFSKDMNATEVVNAENYQLMDIGLLVPISINSITYNSTTHTATLNINGGTALADGSYTLTVSRWIPDTDGFTMEANFTRTFHVDRTGPLVLSNTVVGMPGSQTIVDGAALTGTYTQFVVSFSSDVSTAGGATGADSATNPLNYLLLQPGPDNVFDTTGCDVFAANSDTPLDDDILISTTPVIYSNGGGTGPFTATITVNGGTPLLVGTYRLLICGTTSIVDLVGNPLNGGTDTAINFRIYIPTAPTTGFAPGIVTQLGLQPADVIYSDQSDLTITIPSLGVDSAIVGVPVDDTSWNIAWLYDQVGWLEGTAYPTWNGNSVLTAHAYTADGLPGPFANLRSLGYGSLIMIHMDGMVYTYVVQSNTLVSPLATSYLTRSDTYSWLTLVTCQNYDEQTDTYRYRRVVRAVLVSVSSDN